MAFTPDKLPTLFNYAELDCISNFSFLRGASHPEELVQRAARLGYSALALSDECSMSGLVRAHQEAKKHQLQLIAGSRFRTGEGELIILACDGNGYGNLCELITLTRLRATKGRYEFHLNDILAPQSDYAHLKGLPDCLFLFKPDYNPDAIALHTHLQPLVQSLAGRFWLGLARPHYHADAQHQNTLTHVAQTLGLPIVALGQVEMHQRSRQPLHDVMTAIRLKKTVHECGYALRPNAEHHLRSRLRLSNIHTTAALQETLEISQRCTFTLDRIRYHYPDASVPRGMTSAAFLNQETLAGARWRYPEGISTKVLDQITQELAIIAELDYEAYFLTVYDIVRFARSQDILCQGRGSAANSAVCYCLGITEVDPDSSNTLFARFISRERNEPPDIDVDFEHHRREEVIQYIYQKYGRSRAALTAVVITYRMRSALRDTGKALGLDSAMIDQVSASCRYRDGKSTLLERIHEQGFDTQTAVVQQWAALTQDLLDFPRHLSQHPGGFVISQHALPRLVPIENAAMPERSIVQWDKNDLDALGILKIDILALGMLSALQRCLKLVSQRRGQHFSLRDISIHDPDTYQMIQKADTVGVFQIESRAQMSMLPRLKPAVFYDLVIQVAIVRPGPIQGGMVHPYLRRRQSLEKVSYPNPELQGVLERTLGVVIFQEQAMQVAMIAADFSAEEADQLRRSMAAWNLHGNIEVFRTRLIRGMLNKGYTSEFAENLFQQLEGFGDYGFPESHAASFARLAWFSAWLKCHEPAAFLVSLLNSQPMGFYSPSQLVQDARRHGVHILPIDVQYSLWESTLETDLHGVASVRLGFRLIKHLSATASQRIIDARLQGRFTSTHDLAIRADLTRSDLEPLAIANALEGIAGERRQALWHVARPTSKDLLKYAPINDTHTPELATMPEAQSIAADYASTGLTLGRHPLALLRIRLLALRFEDALTLSRDYPDRRLARACGLVTVRQRPQTANGTVFITLEDETGNVNVIVRPNLAEKQRIELTQSRLLGIYGVWQRQSEVCHLLAERLVNLDYLLGELKTKSRDFH